MPAPTIPLYTGTTPQRTQSPTDFANNADDWLTYQAPLAADYNNLATYLDALALTVEGYRDDAANSAAASAASAVDSSGFAQDSSDYADLSAASANFKGNWSDLTGALSIPSTVLHNGAYWQLLTNLADVTLSEPGIGNSDWALTRESVVVPKTAAATLSINNPNELQDGSAFSVPLASSVPANWYIDIELPRKFKAFRPTLVRSGSDVFAYEGGTDTEIEFKSPNFIRLTSDGVSEWRL